ncbi:hypothetical protein [Amycolatopsis sp. NPDC059657]|uniref:hypothetical protein n=1 Tax=Amycolatopsis sp. NPDC059657 TaxID=3346899 RepID=UPI00366F316D
MPRTTRAFSVIMSSFPRTCSQHYRPDAATRALWIFSAKRGNISDPNKWSVIAGWLADNYSRKRALMVSLAVSGVFTATLAVTTGLTTFLVLCFWQAWALAEFGASYRPM